MRIDPARGDVDKLAGKRGVAVGIAWRGAGLARRNFGGVLEPAPGGSGIDAPGGGEGSGEPRFLGGHDEAIERQPEQRH